MTKRNMATSNSSHQPKGKCNFDQNNRRAVYIASSESCELKTINPCWNKFERMYFQEQQPNQFYDYKQSIDFVNTVEQNVVKYRILSVFSPKAERYRPKITPSLDAFHAVIYFMKQTTRLAYTAKIMVNFENNDILRYEVRKS